MTSTAAEQLETFDTGNANAPQQLPLGFLHGEPIIDVPHDLYIPPEALEVFLEAFEGPLDLLLYLIKRENVDILDIPLAEITRQYIEYVEILKGLRLELAADYLVMAAMLAEIKSRMLLPRPPELAGEEEDPRAELVRRLQEYERFKRAAEDVDRLTRLHRDVFPASVALPELTVNKPQPRVELREMLFALKDVLIRSENFAHHHIKREALSVRERMTQVLSSVRDDQFTEFTSLFPVEEGRMGVVVTLLAVLELIKEGLIELVQSEHYGPIHVKALAGRAEE
jgi:segregation and condensation protein A